jgi:hypothetical protein
MHARYNPLQPRDAAKGRVPLYLVEFHLLSHLHVQYLNHYCAGLKLMTPSCSIPSE